MSNQLATFEQVPSDYVPGTGELHAILHTNMGDIDVLLYESRSPKTVANFVGLATGKRTYTDLETFEESNEPFYDGVIFHRVIPGFMIQGGDPSGSGRGGPGYRFADEFNPELRHSRGGLLSMANAGPNTNGSQFFITLGPTPHLDNRHAIFGEVVGGLDVVEKIGNLARNAQDRPKDEVVMERVEIKRV
ncbi:MAG: peptidylprolyl isomerase [Bradymonadaceae bacterium]|nr:peptidylprolyl isomerase [Lujinxingiaceae bacterium]